VKLSAGVVIRDSNGSPANDMESVARLCIA
jgi:hypothetical protein